MKVHGMGFPIDHSGIVKHCYESQWRKIVYFDPQGPTPLRHPGAAGGTAPGLSEVNSQKLFSLKKTTGTII
jgi:hypothetical protein